MPIFSEMRGGKKKSLMPSFCHKATSGSRVLAACGGGAGCRVDTASACAVHTVAAAPPGGKVTAADWPFLPMSLAGPQVPRALGGSRDRSEGPDSSRLPASCLLCSLPLQEVACPNSRTGREVAAGSPRPGDWSPTQPPKPSAHLRPELTDRSGEGRRAGRDPRREVTV